MKQKLQRNIALTFRVNEDERDFIRKKMKSAGIENLRLYLLKMAVCGQIITIDMTDVQECGKMLRSISNNVNQLARHANEGYGVCKNSLEQVRDKLNEAWQQQDRIIRTLTDILEGAA